MSVAQPFAPPDRGASPLMSNNPFRNRIASQISPHPSPSYRSTNPFLDSTEVGMAVGNDKEAATANRSVDKTADAFASLDVADKQKDMTKVRSRPSNGGPPPPRRPQQPGPRGFPHPPGHRPTTSDEDRKRLQSRMRSELDIFADPFDIKPREKSRKPRRNSETSVMEKTSALDPEEERKRRERKHRESRKPGSKSTKPSKKLDVIDKLDVTSIYGTGLFHHDGPFDACNPHRNRKKEKYAPIQAFPKDSVNMIMGGSGPINKTLDYNKFHGYGEEAHRDYNEAAVVDDSESYRKDPATDKYYGYNPTSRDHLHGDESAGLGTSTFLEGAPASKSAMQRRESENDAGQTDERPGLSRTKSLAQRIRGVRPNRDRFASPDSRNGPASPRVTGYSEGGENPFFKDVNAKASSSGATSPPLPVKEGTTITFDEQTKPNRPPPPPPASPKRNELERHNTNDSVPEEPATTSKPSGLLGRMKSLKGGRRPAPRRDTSG